MAIPPNPLSPERARYHRSHCAVCGLDLGSSYWMVHDGAHEACIDWSKRPFPYSRQIDVVRRLARHADPGRERDVLMVAARLQDLAHGWPDRALQRLVRARELAALARKWTSAAPEKLKASL